MLVIVRMTRERADAAVGELTQKAYHPGMICGEMADAIRAALSAPKPVEGWIAAEETDPECVIVYYKREPMEAAHFTMEPVLIVKAR